VQARVTIRNDVNALSPCVCEGARTLAVFKSTVQVQDAQSRLIGAGMTYLHLRLGTDAKQQATGTVSLKAWTPADAPPAALLLEDGRTLPIQVSHNVLSECSNNHILRYQASWPPASSPPPSSPER
jgi:hypothetical protein